MTECPNFPGTWSEWAAVRDRVWGRRFTICKCHTCRTTWPNPKVKAGEIIEVATSNGVFVASTVDSSFHVKGVGLHINIEAHGPTHRERTQINPDVARWRKYGEATHGAQIHTSRFDREEVI